MLVMVSSFFKLELLHYLSLSFLFKSEFSYQLRGEERRLMAIYASNNSVSDAFQAQWAEKNAAEIEG